MKKKYLIYVIMPLMAFAVMGVVYANSSATGIANPMSNLVTAIAQRFNLNVSDVQQVFDEQRAKMEAQREQTFTDRINQAVTDGKLTQDQADKILAKKAELEAQRTSLEGKTEEERRTAMKGQTDALKQWVIDNNIPQEYLPFLGFGMGRGHGGPGGPGFGRPAFGQPWK